MIYMITHSHGENHVFPNWLLFAFEFLFPISDQLVLDVVLLRYCLLYVDISRNFGGEGLGKGSALKSQAPLEWRERSEHVNRDNLE